MSGNVVVKTRTTRRLRDRFERVAKRNGRSIARELEYAMQQHVDMHDAPKEGRP